MLDFWHPMALVFEHPEPDSASLLKAGYVLCTPEVDGIRKILQIPPEKGTVAHDQWQQAICQIAHPTPAPRFRRWIWNVLNTLRDAVSQSLGMILGTLKTKTPMGRVTGADKRD